MKRSKSGYAILINKNNFVGNGNEFPLAMVFITDTAKKLLPDTLTNFVDLIPQTMCLEQ